MTERLFIYNENCVMAGSQVPQRELDRYENPEEGWDWTGIEATDAEAEWYETHRGRFGCKVAHTIREALRFGN